VGIETFSEGHVLHIKSRLRDLGFLCRWDASTRNAVRDFKVGHFSLLGADEKPRPKGSAASTGAQLFMMSGEWDPGGAILHRVAG
jgi:hypothetical protein